MGLEHQLLWSCHQQTESLGLRRIAAGFSIDSGFKRVSQPGRGAAQGRRERAGHVLRSDLIPSLWKTQILQPPSDTVVTGPYHLQRVSSSDARPQQLPPTHTF
ncbi:unnamed protein product [Pleuronectes platessa]|uniref:Uncharacterized protein n=1 Tax=Pleuronectes platessa TaxID=8262 RepID=A0A9N7TJK5_PLEPL|nr:unnamed protein product [Pleuronectes platessa]